MTRYATARTAGRARPGRPSAHSERGLRPRWIVVAVLAMLGVFPALAVGIALYPPVPADLGGAPDLDAVAERVEIPLGADHLDGWLVRAPMRHRAHALVVLFHGYGRDHHRAWRYARFLRAAGYDALAVDFRSSRAWSRVPTTLGVYETEDAAATLAWVRRQPELARLPLLLLGESLGGSVALVSAARHPEVRAVVADCPFASSARAIDDTFRYWTRLPGAPAVTAAAALGGTLTGHDPTGLDVVAAADSLRGTPLFLIHAANDDRMRPEQAADIRAAAGDKDELWLTPEGHNEAWRYHRAEYERRVLAFYAGALSRDAGARSGDTGTPAAR